MFNASGKGFRFFVVVALGHIRGYGRDFGKKGGPDHLVAIRNLWHRPVVHLSCDGNGQNLCDISSAVCEDLSFSSPLPESVPPSVMV